jgi:hypothetical protein
MPIFLYKIWYPATTFIVVVKETDLHTVFLKTNSSTFHLPPIFIIKISRPAFWKSMYACDPIVYT